jgi:predicted nucleic acid-binding protein
VEIACVIHRQYREGSLTAEAAAELRRLFLEDLRKGVWLLMPMTDGLLHRVEVTLRRFERNTFIRAGDAIHLVSAIDFGFDEIWTNDRHLLAAANGLGLRGRSIP